MFSTTTLVVVGRIHVEFTTDQCIERSQYPWERTFGVVNLYLTALEPLKKVDDKINVVFCIVPESPKPGARNEE